MKEGRKWSEKYLFKAKRKLFVILRKSRVRIMNFIVLTRTLNFFLSTKIEVQIVSEIT